MEGAGMKPSVYVETTIPSFLVSRTSPVIVTAARQIATRRWWEKKRGKYELYISSVVQEEIGRGDSQYAEQRLSLIADLPRLAVTDEVVSLARELFAHLGLPETARPDAHHLAVASRYEVQYLLTWNLRHLANARVRRALALLGTTMGLWVPTICTPDELL
jgi:predicted nucleic acid-binding protein